MAFLAPLGLAAGAGAGAAGATGAGAGALGAGLGSGAGIGAGLGGSSAGLGAGLAGTAGALAPTSAGAAGSLGSGALSSLVPQTTGPGMFNNFFMKGMPQGVKDIIDPIKMIMPDKNSAPPPMEFPQLQHSPGQMVAPVGAPPSVGNAGPLSGGGMGGGGMSPQLMKLIQMLSQGGGGIG